jgi:hypothetical protein
MEYVAYPAGSFTRTLAFRTNINTNFQDTGFAISDGTIVDILDVQYNGSTVAGGFTYNIIHCPTVTSCTSNPVGVTIMPNPGFSGLVWMQYTDDGATNRKWSISFDQGFTYATVLTEGRTTRLTPTRIGFAVNPESTVGMSMWAAHWQ